MADPKQQVLTFTFLNGALTAGADDFTQPNDGFAAVQNTRQRSGGSLPVKQPGYDSIGTGGALKRSGGFVPTTSYDSTCQYMMPNDGNYRVAGDTLGILGSATSTSVPANAAYPAIVTKAGTLPGAFATQNPAACTFGDDTYYACVRPIPGGLFGVYMHVLGANGEVVVTSQLARSLAAGSSSESWCGLTVHPAGVQLWFFEGPSGAGSIYVASVAVSGLQLVLGSATLVYSPNWGGVGSIDVGTDISSGSYSSSVEAYLVCLRSSTSAEVTITRYNTATHTAAASVNLAWGTNTDSRLAMSANGGVAVMATLAAGTSTLGFYTPTALSAVWAPVTGQMTYGECACGFITNGSVSYIVYAVTDTVGDIVNKSTAGTRLQYRTATSGSLVEDEVLPWRRLLSRGTVLPVGASELYWCFLTQRMYDSATANLSTSVQFLVDPSVELYWTSTKTRSTMIGRFGVDIALRYSGTTLSTHQAFTNSTSTFSNGSTVTFTYLEDNTRGFVSPNGYTVRYVEVDFAEAQPRYALTAEGPSVTASALPLHWDGFENTEVCPTHQPVLSGTSTTGSGGTLNSGTYSWIAMFQWRDAAGQMHRSAPSLAKSYTGAALAPKLWVTVPNGFRDGGYQENIDCVIYATLADQAGVYYAQPYVISNRTGYFIEYNSILQPVSGATAPLLYSTGAPDSPLVAQCPPAFTDAYVVGDRAWGIEAERPWIVWPSKQKEPGVAFEWNSVLNVSMPSAAGNILAISENGGFPVFLCQRGVFGISGAGLNNAGTQGGFSPPQQLSTLPCTDPATVVKTPVGVMFVSGDRFAIVGAQEKIDTRFDASPYTYVSAYVDTLSQEVVWLTKESVAVVYSYALDHWRTWTMPPIATAAFVPTSKDVLLRQAAAGGASYLLSTASATGSSAASWSTGWVLLGDFQDDNQIHDILLHGYLPSETGHGVTIDIRKDYNDSVVQSIVWAAADIDGAKKPGSSRYTISGAPGLVLSARSVKLTFTETDLTTGTRFQPITCHIVFGKLPGVQRQAIQRLGRK